MSANNDEILIGGIAGLGLSASGSISSGYGIYVTNRRIIGIKKGFLKKNIVSGVFSFIISIVLAFIIGILIVFSTGSPELGGSISLGIVIVSLYIGRKLGRKLLKEIAPNLVRDLSPKSIAELDANKDYEVYKENIEYIEIRKPTTWRLGYVKIVSKAEGKNKKKYIDIKDQYTYEQLLKLLKKFYPEALRVKES